MTTAPPATTAQAEESEGSHEGSHAEAEKPKTGEVGHDEDSHGAGEGHKKQEAGAAPADEDADYIRDDDQAPAEAHVAEEHVPPIPQAQAHGESGEHGDGEHGAGHEAHGHGEHGEHHHQHSQLGVALAAMLLGAVGFVMALFYLVHFPDPDIRLATWKMLSSTISIFVAVAIFLTTKEMTELVEGHVLSPAKKTVVSGVRALFITVAMEGLLMFFVTRRSALEASGTLAAHVTGFAFLDFLADMQEIPPLSDDPLCSLVAFAAGIVVFALIFWMGGRVRHNFAHSRGVTDFGQEGKRGWKEECIEVEDDVMGLALAFVLSRSVRFFIAGELPPVYGNPLGKTFWQVKALLGCSLGFGAFVVLLSPVVVAIKNHTVARLAKCAQLVCSMAMGWSLLYTGQWSYWAATGDQGLMGKECKMLARIAMAIINSVIVIVAIIVLDFIADRVTVNARALRSLSDALGLLLGLSWEAAFDQAVESAHEEFHSNALVLKIVMGFCMCVVVTPAWQLYILPAALGERSNAS